MTTKSMTEEIMSKYVVRVTKKADFKQNRFCGQPLNPDGVSFDIPAGLADYYRTVMFNKFTFSEPFLKTDAPPKIETIGTSIGKTLGQDIQMGNEEPINPPEAQYKCVCGYTAKQYMAFMRHVERCEKERRKKAKQESLIKTQEEKKPETENYLSFAGREETGLHDLIDVGNDYVPTVNAKTEAEVNK